MEKEYRRKRGEIFRLKIAIIGAPGSGKGTQAEIISKEFKLKHIIASEIIKKSIRKNNSIRKIIEHGDLLPENIIEPIMRKYIPKENFIIDGYPRKISQARTLDKINKPDIILVLDAPLIVFKKRLLKRAGIEKRIDDNEKIILHRFIVYNKETRPLLKYYKNRIIIIDAKGTPKNVNKKIRESITRLQFQ